MKLNDAGLKEQQPWINAHYQLPAFDRDLVKMRTMDTPQWIHFGAGNIFRAFQANVVQQLLDAGEMSTGILAAAGFDYEIIEKLYRKTDDYSILVTLKADGTVEKKVIGSIAGSFVLDRKHEKDFAALRAIFRNPSLQMASFSITEKGYALKDPEGSLLPEILCDFEAGPQKASSYLGKVVSLLYERFAAGELPVALVSMDNCSRNGDKIYDAVSAFARAWKENGLVSEAFPEYVSDPEKVSYPWSMIDKITPRPDEKVLQILKEDGIEDLERIVTSKNSYLSKFVNAEEAEYLVIEDWFPNGRSPLEKGGVILTDRDTVEKAEKMKVCSCLNPVHTALAVFGCLLGYRLIADEMKDPLLNKLAWQVGEKEGLPMAADPGILVPADFLQEVLTKRFPNPFIPDTPQRIAMDTSQKIPIRFGETIKAYLKREPEKVRELTAIPLVFAGWLRYLLGVDDTGNPFEISSDPLLPYLKEHMKGIGLGKDPDVEEKIRPLLKNCSIFGVDLYQSCLAGRVLEYLKEMLAGEGAVRRTLEQVIGGD